MPVTRAFAALLLCLHAGLSAAAEVDWEPFASSQSAVVLFDRGSVKKDDYVQYRIRVEYADERVSKDGKHRYRSAVNAFAAQCEEKKLVVTSVELRDNAGARLLQSTRRRERWAVGLKDVKTGGMEERLMLHACAIARGETPKPAAKAGAASTRATASIGSGIVASTDGVIVTNHHVVDACSRILVIDSEKKRAMAERVASDPKSDLAIIRANRTFTEVATFRRGVLLQAGESVTVVGYPLASILGSESNVAFGYVSATSGVRGDVSRFQISAPVHKGNSGGPILDQSGNVTGIVNAKLDALAVQKRTGDLPQNISFGIKAEVAQLFLETHGVKPRSGSEKRRLENTEVAAIGRAITVLVGCRKEATPAASQAKGSGGGSLTPPAGGQ
jgi:S1-C subfamily serine protease